MDLPILSGTLVRAGDDLRARRADSMRSSYARLFTNLPEWKPTGSETNVAEHLWELAEKMYADRDHDNNAIPAGYTYLGQLINHDLTFDASSGLQERNAPVSSRNLRTPRFDLDCVYGRGPRDQPYLYADDESGRFLLGANERGELDLPRSSFAGGGKSKASANSLNLRRPAVIGDSRNDENIIVSQLHLAIQQFHNRLIGGGRTFEEARRLTRWHYQWIAIHDFLKRLCTSALVDEALGSRGRPNLRFFNPREHPFVPVEFSVAAYRCGHSMIRPSYAINAALLELRQSPLAIFDPISEDSLSGGRVLPPDWSVQWSFFVDHAKSQKDLQFSKPIGLQISKPLRSLPMPATETPRLSSLAFRTLLRGWSTGLPAGQDVARRMAEPVLDGNDPLWIYILREAGQSGGRHLGPVGARIVVEVFIGLLAADPRSYLAVDPNWTPPGGPGFGFADFLAEAGAPISQREWDERPGA